MKDRTLQLMQLRSRRNALLLRDFRTGLWSLTMLAERYGVSVSNAAHIVGKRMRQNGIVRPRPARGSGGVD